LSNQIDRAKLRTTLQYRLTNRLLVGVEYNPLEKEVGPLANFHLLSETKTRPALIIGTSSDRIGTPDGQSFYITVSKNLAPQLKLPIAPYVGVAYGTFEDEWIAIGGLSIKFTSNFSSLFIFDGVHLHSTVNYGWKNHTFSLVMVRSKDPGFSYSIAF
jgi:hypothetical protein